MFQFQMVHPHDDELIRLLAEWYRKEWKVSPDKTIRRLTSFTGHDSQFQVVMSIDDIPVSTAGLYYDVGLLEKNPRFRIYKDWLAQVYTIPERRGQGLGAQLCNYVHLEAARQGVTTMYLYTDTAETLYKRLGWVSFDQSDYGTRQVVLMKKELIIENEI